MNCLLLTLRLYLIKLLSLAITNKLTQKYKGIPDSVPSLLGLLRHSLQNDIKKKILLFHLPDINIYYLYIILILICLLYIILE